MRREDARRFASRFGHGPALALVLALVLLAGTDAWAEPRCRAVDGDTIRCGAERIRLRGVYAPELGEPGGAEARVRLQRRLDEGEVRLERHGRDRYGRTRADVYAGGARIEQRDIGPRGGRGSRPDRAR
jgi:micrococcal nuclease